MRHECEAHPTMGWQRSSTELTAISQPTPLAGPDETSISSASETGTVHPERLAKRQISLAPRVQSIHDPYQMS